MVFVDVQKNIFRVMRFGKPRRFLKPCSLQPKPACFYYRTKFIIIEIAGIVGWIKQRVSTKLPDEWWIRYRFRSPTQYL
jgi:hypothetical protein